MKLATVVFLLCAFYGFAVFSPAAEKRKVPYSFEAPDAEGTVEILFDCQPELWGLNRQDTEKLQDKMAAASHFRLAIITTIKGQAAIPDQTIIRFIGPAMTSNVFRGLEVLQKRFGWQFLESGFNLQVAKARGEPPRAAFFYRHA
jgi:hypothetical protein